MRNNTTSTLDVIVGLVVVLSIVASVMMLVQQVFAEAAEESTVARAEGTDPSLYAVAPAQDTNRPAWFVGSFQLGGQWLALRSLGEAGLTNPAAWYVPSDQGEGVGSLFMVLDRLILTNDLLMELTLLDKAGSSLYVDLLATNFVTLGTNLCGNLIEGSDDVVCLAVPIPLRDNLDASIVRLWRGKGDVLVYETTLSTAIGRESETPSAEDLAPEHSSALEEESDKRSENHDQRGSQLSARKASEPETGQDSGQGGRKGCFYVNGQMGDDSYSGTSPQVHGINGPKRTINAALALAHRGDSIYVASGSYAEAVSLRGTGVNMFFRGSISVKQSRSREQ